MNRYLYQLASDSFLGIDSYRWERLNCRFTTVGFVDLTVLSGRIRYISDPPKHQHCFKIRLQGWYLQFYNYLSDLLLRNVCGS